MGQQQSRGRDPARQAQPQQQRANYAPPHIVQNNQGQPQQMYGVQYQQQPSQQYTPYQTNGQFYMQQYQAQYQNHPQYQQVPQQGQQQAYYGQQRPSVPTNQVRHTDTIRNQVNLKKQTLKFEAVDPDNPSLYTVSFIFDASAPCSVSVFYQAQEFPKKSCQLIPKGQPAGKKRLFEKKLGHKFPPEEGAKEHILDISQVNLESMLRVSSIDNFKVYPVVVRLETLAQKGLDANRSLTDLKPGAPQPDWIQSQTNYAVVVRDAKTKQLSLSIVKQKIWYNGTSYELQEIYGIEQAPHREPGAVGNPDDMIEGTECVVCLSNPREVAVLPCRHLCMCQECANQIQYQVRKCPICRNPITQLIKVVMPMPKEGTVRQEEVNQEINKILSGQLPPDVEAEFEPKHPA